jgi:hypothetical protein
MSKGRVNGFALPFRVGRFIPMGCHTMNNLTSKDIQETIGHTATLRPEWLRIPDTIRYSGIGRSSLYTLIGDGKIRSVSIRKRGAVKGIRLISVDSIDSYLNSLSEAQCDNSRANSGESTND